MDSHGLVDMEIKILGISFESQTTPAQISTILQ